MDQGCGGPTRSRLAHRGPRAGGGGGGGGAGRRAGRRGEEAAARLCAVKAEVAPTWRLRGSHAGRREEEEGEAEMDGGRRPCSPEQARRIWSSGSTPE